MLAKETVARDNPKDLEIQFFLRSCLSFSSCWSKWGLKTYLERQQSLACISSFSIAVMKYHEQKQRGEGMVYFS